MGKLLVFRECSFCFVAGRLRCVSAEPVDGDTKPCLPFEGCRPEARAEGDVWLAGIIPPRRLPIEIVGNVHCQHGVEGKAGYYLLKLDEIILVKQELVLHNYKHVLGILDYIPENVFLQIVDIQLTLPRST